MKIGKQVPSNRGFTLVEVLVALVILSIGLLGVAGMQIHSMRGNHNAFLRSQALQYASEILEMARANRTAAINGAYTLAQTGTIPAVPSPDTVADQDIREWLRDVTGVPNVASGLPGGQGKIEVTTNADSTRTVKITVSWSESRFADMATPPSVVVETKL